MKRPRTDFRPSTVGQRRLLFEIWEETGNVQKACQQAQLSMRTFYYWKPRFEEGGYAALEVMRSHAPKNPHRIPLDIATQVVELKQQCPKWGKLRIAKEIVKTNSTVSSISPNTVRRILDEAGLWHRASISGVK